MEETPNETDKRLIFKIYKHHMQLNTRKITKPIKKWAEDLNRHSSKEDIQNGQQTHEKMLNTLIIRETQIKTTMRYHLTPIRMVIITKSTNSKTRERI